MFEQPTPPENKKARISACFQYGKSWFLCPYGIARDFSAIKMKKVLENQGLFLAEKERFELSRRYHRPTPLAGAPLRPLEYFSIGELAVFQNSRVILYPIFAVLSICFQYLSKIYFQFFQKAYLPNKSHGQRAICLTINFKKTKTKTIP